MSGFAKSWGFGGIMVGNLFGYRSTDPKFLKEQEDPIGPDNDRMLQEMARDASLVVACWGGNGDLHGRDREVWRLLKPMRIMGKTKLGMPRHPLYLKKETQHQEWNGMAAWRNDP